MAAVLDLLVEQGLLDLQTLAAEAAAESRADNALAEWTTERERLAAEITRLRGTESDLLRRIEDDNTQLVTSTRSLEDARRRIETLERTAGQAAAQSDELAALANRVRETEQELGTQRAANLRLQDSLTKERQTQEARLVAAQRENAALAGRLRQAQSTLDQIAATARVMNPTAGNTLSPGAGSFSSPPATAGPAPERTHTVEEGDSLSRISMRYYGTPSRWQDIYQANRELLSEANALRPGQTLRIP